MASGEKTSINLDDYLAILLSLSFLRYDLDDRPSGASLGTGSVCPNKMPFGTFRNNVAHSCAEFGLRIWETYTPFVSNTYVLDTKLKIT